MEKTCPRCGEVLEPVRGERRRGVLVRPVVGYREHVDKDDCLIALLRVVVHELRESKHRHAVERSVDQRVGRYG